MDYHIKKILLLLFTFLYCSGLFQKVWADPLKNIFQNDYLEIEYLLYQLKFSPQFKTAKSSVSEKLISHIFTDPQKIIRKDFNIPGFFKHRVRFWNSIYTQYTTNQVLIHDMNYLNLVYDFVDFSELHASPLNRYVKADIQSRYAQEKVRNLKKAIKYLQNNIHTKNLAAQNILKLLRKNKIPIPRKKQAQRKFFRKLANHIRVQTGQRDMVFQGILNSLPYLPYIEKLLKNFRLPQELLAIPFLESSFNPKALSKVGASGIWQFMPNIAKAIMPMGPTIDSRVNPLLASIGAVHLLRQNKTILKRWDLAVTAYNSGTKHLLRARKLFKRKKIKNMTLARVFKYYKHGHLGFASQNFYAEFLALVYTLAYKNQIFPLDGVDARSIKGSPQFDRHNVKVYLSLCKTSPQFVFNKYSRKNNNLRSMNTHFLRPKRKLNRGQIYFSSRPLPADKYYEVSDRQVRRLFPKKWKRYIRKKKCPF